MALDDGRRDAALWAQLSQAPIRRDRTFYFALTDTEAATWAKTEEERRKKEHVGRDTSRGIAGKGTRHECMRKSPTHSKSATSPSPLP